MKVFILVDQNKIVRCMATEEVNLHKDKLSMKKYFVDKGGIVGDEYDQATDIWTKHPENYPAETLKEKENRLIGDKLREIAITELKKEGKL